MANNTYSIKELSVKFNLPASTLRYYEDIGLLEEVVHDERGMRIYNEQHIARLDGILCFKSAGLSIAKILEFYHYESDINLHSDEILEMMKEQEQNILNNIEELTFSLNHIRDKIYYYAEVRRALEHGEKMPTWDDVFSVNRI